MIFDVATDDRSLLVFPTHKEAVDYCEGIDVETGIWLFWDERGAPLQADFLLPNHSGRFWVDNGLYRLVPDRSGHNASLTHALSNICIMETNPFFTSLADGDLIAQDGA